MVRSRVLGLIVEGIYDTPVYGELIRRLHTVQVEVITRETNGVASLMKTFPALLTPLEYAVDGGPVDRALVVRDAGGRARADVERQMLDKLGRRTYRFPNGVRLFAVRRTVETWLLADAGAISRVAATRNGRPVPGDGRVLEDIEDPKAALTRLLSRARLLYTPAVCGAIAAEMDLSILRARCPSFREFERMVLD